MKSARVAYDCIVTGGKRKFVPPFKKSEEDSADNDDSDGGSAQTGASMKKYGPPLETKLQRSRSHMHVYMDVHIM